MDSRIVLEATGIRKHFGGTQALAGAHLSVSHGEIHALMGENGAGKSTLAKIIAGVERSDQGEVKWRGETVAFQSTSEANRAGITIVLQELSLVPDLSVAENIFLTNSSVYRRGIWLQKNVLRKRTAELLDRYGLSRDISPDAKVHELSIAQQQMIEIVRAFSLESSLYLMDEPTAALGEKEVESLFNIIRDMRDQGVSFVLVTHRLNEVFALSDRITVLRDGINSGEFVTSDANPETLIRSMVGRDLGDFYSIRQRREPGETVASVRGLTRGEAIRDCSFDVRRGEIVGIAGLVGSGRTELVRAIFGADRAGGGGIVLNGRAGLLESPCQAVHQGAAMVPENRKVHGLHLDLPISQNIALAEMGLRGSFRVDVGAEKRRVQEMIRRLKIKVSDPRDPASSLSGGNQQKIVLAKWLAVDPDLLILDEPTRGIDIGTKYEIYRIVDELVAAGKGVLMVSSELPEILALSDRILVMAEGKIVSEIDHSNATEEAIMEYATLRNQEDTICDPEEAKSL